MLNMLGKAFAGIFDNPEDIFLRVKALDILFRGLIINCARTEFAPKAVCTALKKEAVNGLSIEPNNQFRFSLFGMVSSLFCLSILVLYSIMRQYHLSSSFLAFLLATATQIPLFIKGLTL